MKNEDFAHFVETAWNDHGDRPQEVADRLAGSVPLIGSPDNLAAFARLTTHVYGEHLGQWAQGVALLNSLRMHDACDDRAAAALARGIATLRYAGGDTLALEPLGRDDRIAVLAAVAATCIGRDDARAALAAYELALDLAEGGLAEGSPALRALAVGGNNLAAALEQRRDRSPGETAGMVAAARAGLTYWRLAGTWLEEERAHYRLARSLLQAGDSSGAAASAQACVEVCERNDAPAFERFFGLAVLALAQAQDGDAEAFAKGRAAAMRMYDDVPADERQWCQGEIDELNAHSP